MQLEMGGPMQRIVNGGPIDGDNRDRPFLFDDNIFVFSVSSWQCALPFSIGLFVDGDRYFSKMLTARHIRERFPRPFKWETSIHHRLHLVLRDRVYHRLKVLYRADSRPFQALLFHHHEWDARRRLGLRGKSAYKADGAAVPRR